MGTCRDRERISSSHPLFPWDSYRENKVYHYLLRLGEPEFESRLVSFQSLYINPLCPHGSTVSWLMSPCLPGTGTWIRGFGGLQDSEGSRITHFCFSIHFCGLAWQCCFHREISFKFQVTDLPVSSWNVGSSPCRLGVLPVCCVRKSRVPAGKG